MALKRRNPRQIPVRKNFAFLVPLVPYIPYIAAGVAGLFAVNYATSTAEKAGNVATQYIGAGIGAGGGYLIARRKKMDVPYQIAATVLGGALGLLAQKAYEKATEKAEESAEAAREAAYQEQWSWYDPTSWGREWK